MPQDLEHPQCGHQCAPALLDHVADCGGDAGVGVGPGSAGPRGRAAGGGAGQWGEQAARPRRGRQQDSLHRMEESLEVKGGRNAGIPQLHHGRCSSSRSCQHRTQAVLRSRQAG